MAKNEKLYLALLAAFAIGDDREASNEVVATAVTEVIGAFAETVAQAVMAAQPAMARYEVGSVASVEPFEPEQHALRLVVATAISNAQKHGGIVSEAATEAANAFRAGMKSPIA